MAITALVLGGIDVVPGGTTTKATDITIDGSYTNLTTDTLTSDTTGGILNMSGDSVDTSTFGTYSVVYTATDDAGAGSDVVFTETVTIRGSGNVNAEFDTGNVDRYGNDTTGTAYNTIVDAANAGTAPKEVSSAYFDETALDPYEVKHSS